MEFVKRFLKDGARVKGRGSRKSGSRIEVRDDRGIGWRKIPPTPFTKGVREGGMTGGIKFIIAGEGYRIV